MTTDALTPTARNHLGRIARGSAAGLVGAVVAGAAGFLVVLLVARNLPPAQAGVFFTVTALFMILEGVAVLGIDTGLARFLQRLEVEAPESVVPLVRWTVGAGVAVGLTLAVTMVVLVGPATSLAGLSERSATAIRVVAFALPFAVLCDLSLAVTRAFNQIRESVLVDRILRAGSQPVAVGLAIWLGADLPQVVLTWALTHVLASMVALRVLCTCLRSRRTTGSSTRPAPGLLKQFWSFTWLRAVARVAQIGMQKVDILLVAALGSVTMAAAYTVATRFVPLGQLATQSIQQVIQPRLTTILVHSDSRTLAQVHQVSTAWSMLLAWPLYLGVAGLAGTYLELFGLTGEAAKDARVVVVLMALTMLVAVASGPVDTLLLMAGRSGLSAANTVVALGIDVVGCLLLVPRMGIVGAGVAWAAAVVTRCGCAFWQVRRDQGIQSVSGTTLLAGLVPLLGVGVPVLGLALWNPPAALLWSGVLVIALCYLTILVAARHLLALDMLMGRGVGVAA